MSEPNNILTSLVEELIDYGYVDLVLRSEFTHLEGFKNRDKRFAISNMLYQIHVQPMEDCLQKAFLSRLGELIIPPEDYSEDSMIEVLDDIAFVLYLVTELKRDNNPDGISECMAMEWIALTIKKLLVDSVDTPLSLQVSTIPMSLYEKRLKLTKRMEEYKIINEQENQIGGN